MSADTAAIRAAAALQQPRSIRPSPYVYPDIPERSIDRAYSNFEAAGQYGPADDVTPEFRLRLLELHDALRQALVEAGTGLSLSESSLVNGGQSPYRTTLKVHDTFGRSGDDVMVELQLESGRQVDLTYPRRDLRGMPSDLVAWALLKDLEKALEWGGETA